MADRKAVMLTAINFAVEQLNGYLKSKETHGFIAKMEQQFADVRTQVKQDGLLSDLEIIYALERYENALKAAGQLTERLEEDVRALRALTRQQFNWNAEQESKAFVLLASFSEKLVVIASGYLGVSVTLFGMVRSHLPLAQPVAGLKLYIAFLILSVTGIGLAAVAQFMASRTAHLHLLNTSKLQMKQMNVETALAFSSSLEKAAKGVSTHKPVGTTSSSTLIVNLNLLTILILTLAAGIFSFFVVLNVRQM